MKKFKILLFLALSSLLTSNAFASTIDKIEVIDNNSIGITTSNDVEFSSDYIEWDIKILKDISVSYSSKDLNDSKKVTLNLWDDLVINNSYSLISILWAEWNIDFEIWEYLEWEISNKLIWNGEVWIDKINIIDSRTIELFFTDDLEDDLFEFKILSDIPTVRLTSEWNNVANLEIKDNLEKESEYILMVLSLEDKDGNTIVLDEDLYDFTTSADLIVDAEEKEVVLAAAKEEVVEEKWNMNEIALAKEETPDTGAATWVLVLLTAIVNLGFFLRKKIIK